VTIVYYTNNGKNQQILSLSIPYEKYDAYHKKNHPYWGENNLTSAIEYVSSNETIINQIVETVKGQTKNEEELANALLDLVQDKESALSIRYYPTTELKYPIETLVEMGGDCDTHSFLYGTLMKAAGFKVLFAGTHRLHIIVLGKKMDYKIRVGERAVESLLENDANATEPPESRTLQS
jgi:hypothetical protein